MSAETPATSSSTRAAAIALKSAFSAAVVGWAMNAFNEEKGTLPKRLANVVGSHPVAAVIVVSWVPLWYCTKPALVSVLKRTPKASRSNLAVFVLTFVSAGTHLWNLFMDFIGLSPFRMSEEETTMPDEPERGRDGGR